MNPGDKQQNGPSARTKLVIIAGAGTQLGAVLGTSAFVGALADEKLGTTPWLFLLLLISGFVGGFWNFFRILKRYQNNGPTGPSARSGSSGQTE